MRFNKHGIYGAFVFVLLHHDGSEAQRRKLLALERVIDELGHPAVPVVTLPEAKRVYLTLCKRFSILPEATVPL